MATCSTGSFAVNGASVREISGLAGFVAGCFGDRDGIDAWFGIYMDFPDGLSPNDWTCPWQNFRKCQHLKYQKLISTSGLI